MADLFIVRLRLKATLWFTGAVFVGCLFGTWDAWNRIGLGGEGEPRFLLFASVTGALTLALVGLFIVFLTVGKLLEPRRGHVGWWERIPWWAVRVVALLVLIGAGTVVLLRLSAKMANEFTLLRKGRVAELGEYIDANPAALERKDRKTGYTLLESALASGNAEVVEMLFSRGVDLSSATNGHNWVVEMLDNPPMLKTLLWHGSDPNAPDALDLVPVFYAAKAQNTNALAMLLEVGADVDARNTSSQTPLQLALMADDLPAAQLLLEQGADPNEVDRSGDTALHKAVRRRNADAVRYLLENGADSKIFNFSDMAPIHIAAFNGQAELVEILLEPGSVELCGKANRTAFDHSLRRHKYDTARLLLENGANIDRVMEDGYTATHLMLIARDYEVVKFLIEEGADVRIADNKGETALFFMRKKQLQSLLDLIAARDNPEAVETNAVEAAESP